MTNPLFVADLATLKAKVRLAELPSVSAANSILDEVILVSRLDFYRRLGTERVTFLLSIAFNENPTTVDEVLRALANAVEVKLVRCHLLRRLPTTFMDASGEVNKTWNEEAPVRELGVLQAEQEIQRCQAEIEADMQILEGETQVGDECSEVKAYDGTPDFCPPKLGGTIRPNYFNHGSD